MVNSDTIQKDNLGSPFAEILHLKLVATPEPDPTRLASSNRKPGDARLILLVIVLLNLRFQKLSRPESPARPEWRIRTGARFTPAFSFILSKHFINLFSCASGFSFGQAHNHLQIQSNSVGPQTLTKYIYKERHSMPFQNDIQKSSFRV